MKQSLVQKFISIIKKSKIDISFLCTENCLWKKYCFDDINSYDAI